MGFESFSVLLSPLDADDDTITAQRLVSQAKRQWPDLRTDALTSSEREKASGRGEIYLLRETSGGLMQMIAWREKASCAVRVELRFAYCNPTSIDAPFCEMTAWLMRKYRMRCHVAPDLAPEQANVSDDMDGPDNVSEILLPSIAYNRRLWQADADTMETAALRPGDAIAKFIAPRLLAMSPLAEGIEGRESAVSKPFDATTKYLLEAHPRDLLEYIGLPAADDYEVEAIDADLSTVTADADKILRVGGPKPSLTHIEAQSGPDTTLDERALHYNVLAGWRHKLRVRSVILLLRPEADSPRWTGLLELSEPDDAPYLVFRYRVIRVWEKPVEDVLAGGLGVLPLAPISDVAESELAERDCANEGTYRCGNDAGRRRRIVGGNPCLNGVALLGSGSGNFAERSA